MCNRDDRDGVVAARIRERRSTQGQSVGFDWIEVPREILKVSSVTSSQVTRNSNPNFPKHYIYFRRL